MRKSNKRKLEIAHLQTALHEKGRTIAAQSKTISSMDCEIKVKIKEIDSLKGENAALLARLSSAPAVSP